MPAQPSLSTIWATIQSVIQTAAGVPMIWKSQNSNQPAMDYGVLSLGSFSTAGIDFTQETVAPEWLPLTEYEIGDRVLNDTEKTYTCTAGGTSDVSGGPTGTTSPITDGTVTWDYVLPGSEVAISVGGVREVALQLEVFSTALVETLAAATALSICDRIVTLLRLPTARDALDAVGFTPFDPGPATWVPAIVSIGFRGLASCDIRCRIPARALTEYATFIASISGTATISGGGVAITETFTA